MTRRKIIFENETRLFFTRRAPASHAIEAARRALWRPQNRPLGTGAPGHPSRARPPPLRRLAAPPSSLIELRRPVASTCANRCGEGLSGRGARGGQTAGEGGRRCGIGAGSVQGVTELVVRAQGPVRGAGAHLWASTAASSTHRRPRGRRGRRAMMYGRRLKPAPGLLAAASTAVELSRRLHRPWYLKHAKKGRQALFGASTKRHESQAALTARARRRTPPHCAPSLQKLFGRPSVATRMPAACSSARTQLLITCLQKEKRALDFEGPVQPSAARPGEGPARAGSYLLMTAV